MSLTENIWIWSKGAIDLASMPTTTVISGVSYAEISFRDSVSEEFIAIGVTPSLDMVYRDANGNNVTVYSNGGWSESKYRTIIFNENASMRFENWFRKNATYRPNDLTNTTWEIREEIAAWGTGNYSVNFTSNNTNYRRLYPVDEQTIRYNTSTWGSGTIVYQYGQWLNQNHRTIHITGGTDVTNESLILWLVNSADLQVPEYTVSYNAVHGTRPSKTVLENYYLESDDLTPMPDVEGYKFISWDKSVGYQITQNTTINAQWEQVTSYTVTFNRNGHGTAPPSQIIEEGQKATKPTDPTAGGYRFDGWFTEQACINEFDFNTPITANRTLWAKWTAAYTVTFNMHGHGTQVPRQAVVSGDTAERPPDPSADGYRFDGWYTESSYTNLFDFDTPITSNITLHAKWTQVITYSVTYSTQFGSVPTKCKEQGTTLTSDDLPLLEHEGYRFGGWYLDETYHTPALGKEMTENITVYAKWTEITAQLPLYIGNDLITKIFIGTDEISSIFIGNERVY